MNVRPLVLVGLLFPLSVLADHPSLFADARDFARLRGDRSEFAVLGREKVLREATAMLDFPVARYEKEGRRLLHVSQLVLKRTLFLSMAFQLSGRRDYARRALDEVLAVAAFPDWNPNHFLDTAEMCLGVAIAYDWLYSEMTEREREVLEEAILRKALTKEDGSLRTDWWVRAANNWGQVCNGGLLAGAIALRERQGNLCKAVVQRTVDNLPCSLSAYAEGGFPEGPSVYWHYATSYTAVTLGALEKAYGHDFSLGKTPGLSRQMDYIDALTGPTGIFFNYADGGIVPGSADGTVRGLDCSAWFLARHYGTPEKLKRCEEGLYRAYCLDRTVPAQQTRRSMDRLFPLILLWLPEASGAAEPAPWPCALRLGGRVPVAVLRAGTGPLSDFAGLKGGRSSEYHGHMDGGSFVYDSDGVRWAIDLGSEDYNRAEQAGLNFWSFKEDSDRWRVFRLGAEAHNVLRIDDQPLKVAGDVAVDVSSADGCARATADLSALYQTTGRVARALCLTQTSSPELVVADRLDGVRPGAKVTWQMITSAEVETCPDGTLRLKKGGKVKKLAASVPVAWRIESIEQPRNRWDSPNPGKSRVTFDLTVPASGRLAYAVTFSADATPCVR